MEFKFEFCKCSVVYIVNGDFMVCNFERSTFTIDLISVSVQRHFLKNLRVHGYVVVTDTAGSLR